MLCTCLCPLNFRSDIGLRLVGCLVLLVGFVFGCFELLVSWFSVFAFDCGWFICFDLWLLISGVGATWDLWFCSFGCCLTCYIVCRFLCSVS